MTESDHRQENGGQVRSLRAGDIQLRLEWQQSWSWGWQGEGFSKLGFGFIKKSISNRVNNNKKLWIGKEFGKFKRQKECQKEVLSKKKIGRGIWVEVGDVGRAGALHMRVKYLCFILNELGSHWKILSMFLSKGMDCSVLYFVKITLGNIWRMGYKGTEVKARKSMRRQICRGPDMKDTLWPRPWRRSTG